MLKRFKKLHLLLKKRQEYCGLKIQTPPMVFGRTRKFWEYSFGILQGSKTKVVFHCMVYGATGAGIPLAVVHPHSFRHRFAKNFIEKYNDIALLADLMGHESIETTRIYLRMTASEQQKIVDKVVTW